MKNSMKKLISFMILLSVLVLNLTYISNINYAKDNNKKTHKEIALDIAKKQLEEQNAERFLPLVEKEIEQMYGSVGMNRDTTGYFPNGGAVKYKQKYTVPSLTVCKVFFSNEAYNIIINGNPLPKYIIDNIGSVVVGIFGFSVSVVGAICSFGSGWNDYNIKQAGGALKFYAEDANGSTNILLPWWDHPYGTYQSDAEVKKF